MRDFSPARGPVARAEGCALKPSVLVLVVLGLLPVGLAAAPARACLWVGSTPASSAGKLAQPPRTEAERKHQEAHADALASHLGAVARRYASVVLPTPPAAATPGSKNH